MSDKHDAEYGGHEPVLGLPQRLPAGERMLWQGKPGFASFARRAVHLRSLAIYFAVLLAWYAVWSATGGSSAGQAMIGMAQLAGLSLVALGLVALYAWLVVRSTVYTITDKRVVMRFGIALPMTVNLPFAMIQSAGARGYVDGSGDIALAVKRGERLAYLLLWPHARPWRFTQTEPMLRCVPDAAAVTQSLSRALAASAGIAVQPAPAMHQEAAPQLAVARDRAAA